MQRPWRSTQRPRLHRCCCRTGHSGSFRWPRHCELALAAIERTARTTGGTPAGGGHSRGRQHGGGVLATIVAVLTLLVTGCVRRNAIIAEQYLERAAATNQPFHSDTGTSRQPGFVLLVSRAASAAITAFGWISAHLPFGTIFLSIVNIVASPRSRLYRLPQQRLRC
jgi:hypothetical protein